jgi:hypothetical protein
MVAMSMAEKHEEKPSKASTTKSRKFRKTADFGLNSASAWNDFNLNLLGADYVKQEYHELPCGVSEFSMKDRTDSLSQRKLLNDGFNDKDTKSSLKARIQCRRRT